MFTGFIEKKKNSNLILYISFHLFTLHVQYNNAKAQFSTIVSFIIFTRAKKGIGVLEKYLKILVQIHQFKSIYSNIVPIF